MSKLKSPQEKKAVSLKRDRRNTYGENPQASRKGIRRGKQRSHMGERRAVSKILGRVRERPEESDEADVLAKTKMVESDLTGVFCTTVSEREFTRRTAGNAQQ